MKCRYRKQNILPFLCFFNSSSCWSTAAPKSVNMIPACELMPTAVTNIFPLPSITWVPWTKKQWQLKTTQYRNVCFIGRVIRPTPRIVPDNTIGSNDSPFFTWSDSPVSEDSSIFKSLLWMSTPSAGSKSPYFICTNATTEIYYYCTTSSGYPTWSDSMSSFLPDICRRRQYRRRIFAAIRPAW